MTPWEIEGRELINCNCSYGCPCQFNALPTHGHCEAMGAIAIERGHHGDVSLDGLKLGVVFRWPGPIHEGHGKCQPIVDERATPAQREALLKIMSGQDTDPFATMFAVFSTTLDEVYEPVFTSIDFDSMHYYIKPTEKQPIRNPVTGMEHRARIDLPHGFEYELAEVGSASSQSRGRLEVTLENSYAQFARLHMNGHGLVRHRPAA